MPGPVLAIHGGAGGDGPWRGMTSLDPSRIRCMEDVLTDVGRHLLNGMDAIDAVTIAVEMMEDEPLFNAGRGSVLGADGGVSMDASIMQGQDRGAGAVIGVRRVRHPIRVAYHLLKKGWPVMLNTHAADHFGIENGVEDVGQEWLRTDLRQAQWQKWNEMRADVGATDEDDAALDHDLDGRVATEFSDEPEGMGTVGAVVLDKFGHLASATSTGGMTGKPDGRIGDTPIIGAGSWADDKIAISCTGVGEAYIRTAAAHELAVRMRAENAVLSTESNMVLDMVAPLGGRGGLIAVTAEGDVHLPFQTTVMYRGVWTSNHSWTSIGPD
ncbi:MAG: beta-aspartyl-peptidase [Euryarchaeota archaeon]|nr:beta-aspartyl-peptidase [Euryarchaeota archaeon]|tara:strand:+ start:564 stop:1541 length:978 start_codon:yes stop_codon:yes gene_type:complete